ncbi:phage tail protein [Pseudoalteromonas ruthenica]|uniref:phage tail-collar fiber domain-containing protein n=1 Tax=Pseudoalteromonas ruthenica TaxID=151081 RepID=UPI00241C83FA|nr:phage tail protein [Pseudoalteromonas ruthenica]|tara:strand:+ start:76647 stop:77444 length:798 start_codon:yes stop_codon:yes gene_type:complete
MSQLQITNAGLAYKDAVFAGEQVQNISHFLFAMVPGLDPSVPIDPDAVIDPQSVVHTQPIQAVSRLDGNAVVMSAVLGYETGDFEFNVFGAVATLANGDEVLVAIVHTEVQHKYKATADSAGNYSVKSIVWRSSAIAQQLNVTLSSLPWQITDYNFVTREEFDALSLDKPFIGAEPQLRVYERHLIADSQSYTAPDHGSLNGGEWFSVKTEKGVLPVLSARSGTSFKRRQDELSDNSVILRTSRGDSDLREVVFVWNDQTQQWEF